MYIKKQTMPIVHVQFIYASKNCLSFHQVEIKRGKFYNIPRNERVCKICSLSQIEYSFSSIMSILRIMRKMCVKWFFENSTALNLFNYCQQRIPKSYIS